MVEGSEDSSSTKTKEPTDTVGDGDTGKMRVDEGKTANDNDINGNGNNKEETTAAEEEEKGCSEVVDEITSTEEIAITIPSSEPYEYDARKLLKGAAGGALVLLGCAMVPLPIPCSVPVIMSGMKVLSSEFEAAKRAEDKMTETAHTAQIMLQEKVKTHFGTTGEQKSFGDYELDDNIKRFFQIHNNNDGTGCQQQLTRRCVKFLPYELTMGQYTNSLTTVTFYKNGDYRTIKHKLQQRLEEILKVNPWLTGFLAVKPNTNDDDTASASAEGAEAVAGNPEESKASVPDSDSELKLWYYDYPNLLEGDNNNDSNDDSNDDASSSSNSIISKNMLTCYEPGDKIPFSRSTKYAAYQELLPSQVTVPYLQGLIGNSKEPVWKISIIPDEIEPYHKFAIVVSLSHLIGDAHTYHKLYHMLFHNYHNHNRNGKNNGIIQTGPIEKLNPERRPDIQYHIEKYMGPKEAKYIHKTRENMADQWYKGLMKGNVSTNYDKKETLLFTVSNEWLKKSTEECIAKKIEDDQRSTIQNVEYNRNNPSRTPNNQTSLSSMGTTRSDSGTSVVFSTTTLEGDDVNDIHPTDILLSWWMNTSGADIGMIPHHLRNKLTVLSECDAGNYSTPIPYTQHDFQTPHQIKESIKRGKRYYSHKYENKLPEITTGYTFALGIDWEKHVSKRYWKTKDDTKISTIKCDDNNDDNDDDDSIEEDFHVPYFTERDIAVMPPRMNSCLFFTAKNGRDVVDDDTSTISSNCSSSSKTEEETRIGVFIHATKAICNKITDCGIIDEEPASSKTAEITDGGVGRRSSLIQFKDLDRLTKKFGDSIRLELNDMDFEVGEEDEDDDDADDDEGKKEETK